MESEGRANAGVAGIVVVGVAVVVDVAEVRGIRPISRCLPPVAAGTKPAKIQRITDKNLILKLCYELIICFSPTAKQSTFLNKHLCHGLKFIRINR